MNRGANRAPIDIARAALYATLAGVTAHVSALEEPTFDMTIIDQGMAGDCKMAGDIDGDGLVDAVVGGSPGEGLAWYRWPDWTRFSVAAPQTEFTTDGELGDVDGDGDLDIVVPDGPGGTNLVWFENPRPTGNPATDTWTRRGIAALGTWGKDVEIADFDKDGLTDVATRTASVLRIHFRNANGTWQTETIRSGLSGEGLSSGDVDGDGNTDLIYAGVWLDNPEPGGDARSASWSGYTTVSGLYNTTKSLVTDLDDDGVNEILYSNSEGTGDVLRCEPSTGDPRGAWTSTPIRTSINRCHTLQVADMDLDGTLDVVIGQMHTSTQREITVLYNLNGDASAWTPSVIDSTGVHNAVVADFGGEGAPDIFGCNWTGNPPLRIWQSSATPSDCAGDLTTQGASIGEPGYGTPDGITSGADVSYYVNLWIDGDFASDLTTQGVSEGKPGYGEPDGLISGADLSYFVNAWTLGCP